MADGKVSQLLNALDTILPSTIHCNILLNHESDRVKSVAADVKQQRESGIAHMSIFQTRVKSTKAHYQDLVHKLDLRKGIAAHEFYQLPIATRQDWLSLPVSESVITSLISLFSESKVPSMASGSGQNAVELVTSFVQHKTVLTSDTFNDLMPRVSELLEGYYTIDLFDI